MRKLLCASAGLAIIGLITVVSYNRFFNDNTADKDADDDYWAGLNFGISGWKPQLPIHPRAKPPTQGVYSPMGRISTSRGRPGKMLPARAQDYFNPSQLVPTTGPGNLAPLLGINVGYVNLDASPRMTTDGGAIPGNIPNINPSNSVVTKG